MCSLGDVRHNDGIVFWQGMLHRVRIFTWHGNGGGAHAEIPSAVKKNVIPCAYVRIDKQKAYRSKQKRYSTRMHVSYSVMVIQIAARLFCFIYTGVGPHVLKDRGQRNKSLEKAFHDSEHGPVGAPRCWFTTIDWEQNENSLLYAVLIACRKRNIKKVLPELVPVRCVLQWPQNSL